MRHSSMLLIAALMMPAGALAGAEAVVQPVTDGHGHVTGGAVGPAESSTHAAGVGNVAGEVGHSDPLVSAGTTMTGKIEQDRKRGMRDRDHDYDSDNQ